MHAHQDAEHRQQRGVRRERRPVLEHAQRDGARVEGAVGVGAEADEGVAVGGEGVCR